MQGCWIWHTYIELNTLSQNLNAILTQSGLCQQFFGKFKHNRYEKVSNNTEKISGDIFTHLHLAYDLVPFLGYLKAFKCYIDKAEKNYNLLSSWYSLSIRSIYGHPFIPLILFAKKNSPIQSKLQQSQVSWSEDGHSSVGVYLLCLCQLQR